MWELVLQNKAQSSLDYLYKYDKTVFDDIILELKNLSRYGRDWDKLKYIGNGIKRLRVVRWRVLCTHSKSKIYVWIIQLEKDTKKDYNQWKDYILKKLKN